MLVIKSRYDKTWFCIGQIMKFIIFIFLNIAILPSAYANSKHCLRFEEGLNKNRMMEYIDSIGAENLITKSGRFYSSAYDLNSDGNPEYFYYIDSGVFCGSGKICYISIYENTNKKLNSLGKVHLFRYSKPEIEIVNERLCVVEDAEKTWKSIEMDGNIFHYHGGKYKTLK